MTVVEEYFLLQESYIKKYGEKTFLLYQVGSFFEFYAIENDITMKYMEIFSEICSLNIAKKKFVLVKKKYQWQDSEIIC